MNESTKQSYNHDAHLLAQSFRSWIERERCTRLVDLRWHEWGTIVYIGPLSGSALDLLCDSDDARAMCEWADEQTGRKCSLLQAYVIAEELGLKIRGNGSPVVLPDNAELVSMSGLETGVS